MKCVVWTEKAVAQGTSETGYPYRAIPFGWNAAPGSFPSKPFGQSCFGSWPALGTRTKAYRPGSLVTALPNNPNQSLRHASVFLRQPLTLVPFTIDSFSLHGTENGGGLFPQNSRCDLKNSDVLQLGKMNR